VPVLDREQGITKEDIEQVMEVARAVNLPPDREILHTVCQHFRIDNQEKVLKPEGLEGAKLSVDMLVLHGVRARLNNTVRVAHRIPVRVQDVVFSGLCSALAVLTPDQKKSGVVCIDCGGGTTDYLAYSGGVVAAAGSLGLGGDHVTNDIATAFNIPSANAEVLKRQSGCAVVKVASPAQRTSLPPEVGFPGRSVSLRALHTVIHARTDEILGTVKKRLEKDGVLPHIGAGVVLTGGGAHLKGLAELGQRLFGLPCAVGRPRNMTGLATPTEGPEYATCSGLVQYGFRTGDPRRGAGGGWIRRLFGWRR
jgi:cell division protein FtsA